MAVALALAVVIGWMLAWGLRCRLRAGAVRYRRRRRSVAAFAARAASFGPCFRASFMS
jgi:hypothetical protein